MKRTRPGTFVVGKGKPAFKRQNATVTAFTPQKASLTWQPERKRGESKNVDSDETNPVTFGQTTANVYLFNAMSQGTTPNTHVGRTVQLTSLDYRWSGHCGATTTGGSPLRLLIVYDKQPNGALAIATNIVATDELTGMMNLNNNHRFIVLVDELIPCVGVAGPAAWGVKGHRKFSLPVEFQSNNGDITDITTGAVIGLVWQDGGLLIANPPSHLYVRLRFDDQ